MPSGRKRWNLHDGPQGSLRRLRNQLAEDGCAESQVVLAKQLLDEKCELESDKISNFKQALEWLICATEQAHPEARRMLRRCIRSGMIDDQSSAIVRAKSCLAASRQETVARKAARDLFASLSNGEQYITTAQLERRIREVCSSTLRHAGDDSDTPDEDSPEVEERAIGLEGAALEAAPHPPHAGNGTIRPTDSPDDEGYPEKLNANEEIRNLTVDNLVSAAVDYCQGELPLVSRELTLSEPDIKSLDHIPLLHQAFLHPLVFLYVLYLKLLFYFGNFTFRLSNIELALLLVAYLSVNADSLYHLVPLVLYYVSFAAMLICSFKMLHAKRQFIDFRKWSGLFLRYSDGNLQPDESENLFVKNNLGPFLQFFFALFVNLFLYPFIATEWVLFSEFCVLSFFLMFITLFSFSNNSSPYSSYPDLLAFLSFGINVVAKYPYEKDAVVNQGWRFLDLHMSNYPFYILGSSIEFCLNSRIFFSLLTPLIIIAMAKRDGWQGMFKYALPHCVTLSWLQMFVVCSHGCTTYGLIRGTLGLVCTCLCVPLVGVATASLPVLACLQYVTLSRLLYAVSVLLGLAVSLGITCLMAKSDATKKFVTPFQLLIGVLTLVYLGSQLVGNVQDEGLPNGLVDLLAGDQPGLKKLLRSERAAAHDHTYRISWEDYYTNCNSPSWSAGNQASTQIKCSVLDGANVNWEGYVEEVRLKSVRNRWNDFAEWLPSVGREYFKCYYGDEYASLCDGDNPKTRDECDFVKTVARQSGRSCHLNNHNEYTYEVSVSISSGGGLLKRPALVNVEFPHPFHNMTRRLATNDRVRVGAILRNQHGSFNIGSKELSLVGYELVCVECAAISGSLRSAPPTASKLTPLFKTLANDCIVSAKYILNFICNPVVVFK